MNKLKIAIVGLGGIAQVVHLPILSKMKNVELSAVAELNKSRLNSVAEKFKIENHFTDYREMIKRSDFDAAVIATPTNTHLPIAVDLLEAKKDLLIEKPIALNSKESNSIYQTAAKNNKRVMVGMNSRFRPDSMILKSLINSNELGEIFYIKGSWLRRQSSSQKWFTKKSEAGGGVITDLGIGLLDLSLWLNNYPKIYSVTVKTFSTYTKSVEDSAVIFIKLKNNSAINLEVSWSLHSDRDSLSLTTFGKEGTGHLNPLRAFKRIESSQLDYTPVQTFSTKNLYKKSYENELKHFVGAILGNVHLLSSEQEVKAQMEILDNIYKSAEENREIIF
ncbi:MAG: Gfo/Idh/MocA family oxidoreductase [Melioribacteraceae bacterium]|nr:Gfo/Idh/MocA family oxidoreductase [Melioribacteraceae bacterium]MCF8353106.1 Gfo/Idh/MocA family oxidoreductase [Melioribacteraceae bacterium]MCF8392748.1 Gfo/Idh/MocA family oxidoreductase [Melioribacteraceae bacterium]MCF8418279.1 Gfo/Idh/MocA family oxidoreductase [Melioribacteraceae bacterium]